MASLAPVVRRATSAPAKPGAATSHDRERAKSRVHPKLKVSQPSDALERDADRAADHVMRSTGPTFPMAGPRGQKEEHARRKKDEHASRKTDEHARRKKEEHAKPKKDEHAKRNKDDSKKQAAPVHRAPKKEVKRDSVAGVTSDGSPPAGFEASLAHSQQAGGFALDAGTRGFLEHGFGQPLDHVRVHTGGDAASLSNSIDAHAFAIGHDLFFGPSKYQPHTHGGRKLLAHEVAHVVQDAGTASPKAIGRTKKGKIDSVAPPAQVEVAPAGAVTEKPAGPPTHERKIDGARIVKEPIDGKLGTIYLPYLKIPFLEGGFKGLSDHPVEALRGKAGDGRSALVSGQSWIYKGKTPRGSVTARRNWITAALANETFIAGLTQAVGDKFGIPGADDGKSKAAPLAAAGEPHYYLRPVEAGARFFVVGTAKEVARNELVVLPVWDKDWKRHEFDVDHFHELQLGGLDGWENFWVLDASANRSSGSKIHSQLEKDIQGLIADAAKAKFWTVDKGGSDSPAFATIENQWRVQFDKMQELEIATKTYAFWTRPQIQAGQHLPGLKAMSESEIAEEGLKFAPGVQPSHINLFTGPTGGYAKKLKPGAGDEWKPASGDKALYRGIDNAVITISKFDSVQEGKEVGNITGRLFVKASKGAKAFEPPTVTIPILQTPRLGFGLYVDRDTFKKRLAEARLSMKQASPIVVEDSGLSADGELFVQGHIETSLPLFAGINIPFGIFGDTLTVSFPIPTDKLQLGPVKVTEASLEMGVDPEGLTLAGALGFLVDGVGHGRLEAGVSTAKGPAPKGADAGQQSEGGFFLLGSFGFDSDKFDPATISVAYRNNQFTVDATVGLKKGSIPGLKTAQIHVLSAPEGISIDGTAELGIPGLTGTILTVRRTTDGAIDIGADNIPLPVDRIPGVSDATASVHAARNPETGEWKLSGGGSATIATPGVSGKLLVAIDGPLVTIAGENLSLQRGPLAGRATFVVSNQTRDAEGKPVPGEPGEMTASGQAEATLQMGKYLKGTIGGRFLPNGQMEFIGGVALPPTVDLFDRKSFDRVLFKPPSLDIPIFGITAAGQRIGIFATIGGDLSFTAGIGPAQLRDAALSATFNPDRPEETTVHGQANVVVPADAGLRLSVHGGIGAGIPIVSAEAGIDVGGTLGLAAEASAAVTVDWSAAKGLSIETIARLEAHPQFTFDISAYVKVTADVVITEFELYNERWKLASYTFGPALDLGVAMPIKWTEQTGLDFDVKNIDVKRPDIDVKALVGDLVHNLVS